MPLTELPLHKTQIDIEQSDRMALVNELNRSLATALDLQMQVKQAHWNVKGSDFYQLHLLFDEMADELNEFVDTIAERATILGGTALGTLQLVSELTLLPAYPIDIYQGSAHLDTLISRYGIYANALRNSIQFAEQHHDADTADLFTEVSRGIDKRLWFLEAHIQG